MDLGLKGKVALVTGGSRGIGKCIAKRLAQSGCHLVLVARGEEALQKTKMELHEWGTRIKTLPIDLSQRGQSAFAVEETVKEFGSIDILVNNVGGNRRKAFDETTDEDWDEVMDLNFRGPLEAARAAIPYMKNKGDGAILFISSIYGREFGGKGMTIYHTTKAALISLSKSLAIELADSGIRVNTIAPGSILFEGGSWDKRQKADPEFIQGFIEKELPMGRFGTDEEIADAAAFLCSKRASLITGACWNVDGGQSKSMI